MTAGATADTFRLIADPDALVARGLLVLEGRMVLRRAVLAGAVRLRRVLLSTAAADSVRDVLTRLPPDVPVDIVPQSTMNDVAGFNIHRGCLALADRPATAPLRTLDLRAARRVVVLEGVNNPDNIGGVFRNAATLGADAVVLGPHCGDPFYRKAIRTSMGATLLVRWADAGAWPEAIGVLRDAGLAVVAFTPAADATALGAATVPARAALLFGAEGHGLSAEACAAADARVRIEMAPGALDSLNVATASAVALWACARYDAHSR